MSGVRVGRESEETAGLKARKKVWGRRGELRRHLFIVFLLLTLTMFDSSPVFALTVNPPKGMDNILFEPEGTPTPMVPSTPSPPAVETFTPPVGSTTAAPAPAPAETTASPATEVPTASFSPFAPVAPPRSRGGLIFLVLALLAVAGVGVWYYMKSKAE